MLGRGSVTTSAGADTPEFYESASDRNITVGFRWRGRSVAICDVCRMPHYWWVARVFVQRPYRRQNLGSQCLQRAVELVRTLGGPDHMVVAPGGYNTPYSVQHAFYERHGFVGAEMMVLSVRPDPSRPARTFGSELPCRSAGGTNRTP